MAWRCSGKSNTALIENLYRADIITSNVVRSAMSLTDRQFYVGKVWIRIIIDAIEF